MKESRHRPGQVQVTRRGFLVAGAAMGGAIVAPARAAQSDPVIEFARESCGTDAARPRILVGYASMCGSTGEIAAAIGKKLCAAKARVDVRHLPEVTDLAGYDAFVIGSPIQAGMWIAEATKFLRERQDELAKAPVAYFIACMAMSSDKEDSRKLARGYVERPLKLAPKIKPVALGMFAGKVDYAKMPKRFQPVMRGIVPEDKDARDWEAIEKWGQELAGQLAGR
jgi:menaquinone-dependent protoporphyrinogen oxidase